MHFECCAECGTLIARLDSSFPPFATILLKPPFKETRALKGGFALAGRQRTFISDHLGRQGARAAWILANQVQNALMPVSYEASGILRSPDGQQDSCGRSSVGYRFRWTMFLADVDAGNRFWAPVRSSLCSASAVILISV